MQEALRVLVDDGLATKLGDRVGVTVRRCASTRSTAPPLAIVQTEALSCTLASLMAQIVQIAQEANRRSMIENRRWEGALIIGPAVLAPLDHVTISNSSFDAPPEALFIEVADDRAVVGVIGLKNVTFFDCQFQNVGIAGTAESIASFRSGMTGEHHDDSSGAPGSESLPDTPSSSARSA